jgi:hypothetical protein
MLVYRVGNIETGDIYTVRIDIHDFRSLDLSIYLASSLFTFSPAWQCSRIVYQRFPEFLQMNKFY